MSELDTMFSALDSQYSDVVPETEAEKIIQDSEREFLSPSIAAVEREKEKKELQNRMNTYQHKLRTCKNVRNTQNPKINEKRAEMRRKYRKIIGECKLYLDEIKIEEEDRTKHLNPKSANNDDLHSINGPCIGE